MSCGISIHYWIIVTVSIHIVSNLAFTAIQLCIRTDEPPQLQIIVPAFQVIHPRLYIVVIPSVTERILFPKSAISGLVDLYYISPTVINIFYYRISVRVNQTDNVILGVAKVYVQLAVAGDEITFPAEYYFFLLLDSKESK